MTGYIAEPLKRVVRQNDGFGCCVCGYPIIDYHHIVPDSTKPDEIMLLCPNHHREATLEAMTKKEQYDFKGNPYNIQNGFVEGKLKINQAFPVINIGNNIPLVTEGDLVIVENESIFGLEIIDGRLNLSLKLYDSDDNLLAEIIRNEWKTGDDLPWDLESRFQKLRIRRASRDINLEIDATKYPMNIKADLWRKGVRFQLRETDMKFTYGNNASLLFKNLGLAGVVFYFDQQRKIYQMQRHPKYGKFGMISQPTMKKRIDGAIEWWCETARGHQFIQIKDNKKYTVYKCNLCNKIKKEFK